MALHNPQWERLIELLARPEYDYDARRKVIHAHPGGILVMNSIESDYSPGIADPETVAHISMVVGSRVVLNDAGMGYWAYLLAQDVRKAVTAFDLSPPKWTWGKVCKGARRRSELSAHFADTLLSIAPQRKFEGLVIALRAFRGPRLVIYGPDPTSSKRMSEILTESWVQIAEHLPVTRDIHPQRVYTFDRMSAVVMDSDGKPAWDTPTRYIPLLKVKKFDE